MRRRSLRAGRTSDAVGAGFPAPAAQSDDTDDAAFTARSRCHGTGPPLRAAWPGPPGADTCGAGGWVGEILEA